MARIVQRTPRFTIRFLVIIIKVVKGGGHEMDESGDDSDDDGHADGL